MAMVRIFTDLNDNSKWEEIGYNMRDRDGSALVTIKEVEPVDENPYRLMFKPLVGGDLIQQQYYFTPVEAKAVVEALREVMLEITSPTDKLYEDGNFIKKVNKAREAVRP